MANAATADNWTDTNPMLIPNPLRGMRFPVEVALLGGVAFFLPLLEAPKNILAVLYVVAWFANRARTGEWGRRWDPWDTLLALWLSSGFVVATFSGLHFQEWRGALDLVRYGAILWCIKRARYGEREFRIVVALLIVATVVGLGHGYWVLATDPKAIYVELNSVGHVNHSAIYLAIMVGVMMVLVGAYWSRASWRLRAAALIVLAFFCAGLLWMASRGAIGAEFALVALLGLAWWPRSRKVATTLGVLVIVAAAAIGVMRPDVMQKQESKVAAGDVLSERGEIWHTAVTAWKQYPIFGVGMDNYGGINLARLEEWQREAGKLFDAREYRPYGHAHSLYLTTLAERGVYGFGVLMAVLFAVIVSLARGYPGWGGTDDAWAMWGGAFSAWLITMTAGLFNTTLHHEHGILAAILVGFWLDYRVNRDRGSTPTPATVVQPR